MRVTIKSVAEAANVSRGTVDKVLNDRPGVSDEVREKVKNVAKGLGYTVNLVGKALAFQKNPIKIGVIILNKKDGLFKEIYKGIKLAHNELKDSGIIIECCVMQNFDVDEQLKYIKELEKKNIRALALSPLDEEAVKNELNRLAKKDIKIITFNTDVPGINKICFVGQDLKKSGRVAGQLIGDLLPNGGDVAIITGPAKIKALEERKAGFEELIEAEYPNIKIIDTVEIVQDKKSSYLKTIELLEAHSNLNAIFITGGGIGGVGRALHQLNKKKVKFVCFDLLPETIELMKDKTIDFTITQEPLMQGYLPIKILFDYFFLNKIPEKEYLYTKLEIKIRENI
ncbi:MAG: transcriptional regulator, LacI family [Firmicutes bacterium]|nr:transcriptional regulator, LacI family [Bacillota bacterium]